MIWLLYIDRLGDRESSFEINQIHLDQCVYSLLNVHVYTAPKRRRQEKPLSSITIIIIINIDLLERLRFRDRTHKHYTPLRLRPRLRPCWGKHNGPPEMCAGQNRNRHTEPDDWKAMTFAQSLCCGLSASCTADVGQPQPKPKPSPSPCPTQHKRTLTIRSAEERAIVSSCVLEWCVFFCVARIWCEDE